MRRMAPSLSLWFLIAFSQTSVGAQAQELAKGKVRLVGRYKSNKLREGPSKKTYYEIARNREIRFRIGGPTNLILLIRSAKATKTDLEFSLDDKKSHQTSLQAYSKVSRGVYLQIPKATHILSVKSSKPLWIRPKRTKRPAKPDQPMVAFTDEPKSHSSGASDVPLVAITKQSQTISTKDPGHESASNLPPPLSKESTESNPTRQTKTAKASPAKVQKNADTKESKAKDITELCSLLAQDLKQLPQDKRPQRLMVAPIEIHSTSSEHQSLGKNLADELTTCLQRDHGFTLIEKQRRAEVFKEAEKIMTGMVDEASVPKLGRMAGVQALVLGKLSLLGNTVLLQVRAVSVETARRLSSHQLTLPHEMLANLIPESTGQTTAGSDSFDLRNRPVEVRLRILADRLARGFSKLPGKGRYERIVVSKLDEAGAQARDKEIGTMVAAQLSTYLQRDHNLLLLERDRLSDVLKEMELGMTGMVDPAKAAQAGKLIGAQAIVVGSVSEAGANFKINVRLISVESAQVLIAESVSLPIAGMVALAEESVVLRSRSGSIFRSMVVPGWGQFYNRQPVTGSVIIGLEVALVGAAVALHFLGAGDESTYNSANFATKYPDLSPSALAQKATALRESAQDYYQARNIAIYAALGVYLYNIIDAYIFGVDGEKQLGLNATAFGAQGLQGDVSARFSFSTEF